MLFWSIIIAYAFIGLTKMQADLSASPLDKPNWARQPTIGNILFIIMLWPYAQLLNTPFLYKRGSVRARAFCYWFIGFVIQICFMSLLFWGCLSTSVYLFDNIFLQIVSCVVLVFVMSFLAPLITLLFVPFSLILTLILGFFIDIVFPEKTS